MITKLAGLALDARFASRAGSDAAGRAVSARWIAANALACRGIRLAVVGVAPLGARLFALRATSFAAAIAAIAAVPVLIDPATLPRHWRYMLRALGMPTLVESPAAAIEGGASVLGCDAGTPCELIVDEPGLARRGSTAGWQCGVVDEGWQGYRVRIAAPQRMLAA